MNHWRADSELLRGFVRQGDQHAFADLVHRHLDLVFGTARRKVSDPGAAEEVEQNVFTALARKAWRFAPDDSIPAWLHRTTLLECKHHRAKRTPDCVEAPSLWGVRNHTCRPFPRSRQQRAWLSPR